jgi:hypothetical protein
MDEPVYKQTMPYVPIEVKTHRDAYAATLHVLFKHIADFHLCVVKTFSKKYGIPEDDIIQTIQESPEFKNMDIDPALHPVHDDPVHNAAIESLGYKIDAITPPDTVPKKRIVKKKPTAAETITEPPPIPAQIQQDSDAQHVIKKRVVKKKQVPAIESVAVTSELVAVTSELVARERESEQAPLLSQTDPNVIVSSEKKKVIKKTTEKNQAQAPLVAAPLVAAPLDDRIKPKIIKKQKTT